MDGHVGSCQQVAEPLRGRLGDEQLSHHTAAQRGLDQIPALGEEATGAPAADVAMQLRRGDDARRAFGEWRAGGQA
jgi:hypothetical protein